MMPMLLHDDIYYMQQALVQATEALKAQEVPIGAIIVDQAGTIIAKGHNVVESIQSQTGHAEFQAIREANSVVGNWRLKNCTIYVTLEPCAMCMNIILLSRLSGLVYGLSSKIFGWSLNAEAVVAVHKIGSLTIKKGVCDMQVKYLMQNFFKSQRVINE